MKAKTKKKIYIAVVLVIIAAIAIWVVVANQEPEDAKYDSFTMETGTIKKVVVSSASVAAEDISIGYAPVSGEIKLYFEEGDTVKKDEVIAKIGAYSIKAPHDGELYLYVDHEDDVAYGTPIYKIIDFSSIKMVGTVSELDVAIMSVGQEVEITMNSSTDTFTGVVTSIDKEGQNYSGSTYYNVETTLEGENLEQIFIGMTGDIKVETGRVEDVVTAQLNKISFSGSTAYITVKNAEGEYVNQVIEVGFTDGLTIEVVGLPEGTIYYYEAEEDMLTAYMG
ncbi:MAG: HlyD family efflux transporter periplasmic adaptor subunit [Bacillota bacterium]